MGKCPLVSIIVPAYNVENYIEEALQSVLSQTYQNWECIIINDGSTDNTLNIIKKWKEKDSRFRIYEQENQGIIKTRNRGIDLAKGELVAFLDSDDVWLPCHLEHNINNLYENNADFAYSRSFLIKNNIYTNDIARPLISCQEGKLDKKFIPHMLFHNEIDTPAVVCKKQALVECSKFSFDKNAEDLHLWLKLLFAGVRFYSSNKHTIYVRIREGSLSNTDRNCTRDVLEVVFSFKREIQNLGINYNYYFRLWARRYFLLKPTKKHYIEAINYINSISSDYFSVLRRISKYFPESLLKLIVLQLLKLK
ncbi:glycosyltransferase family 2 protein [Riemerella columbipharyngis]|uniref:Glycosyltransferase involved in cell wall bisynthesis n=1 Tax=Riemerella columbipharyngis TaxID=1071918 RepID=A0A1G7EBB2_9FLAO|nr:glycosyltransferase family 2 protein [Riemerella columbipharyngis]SDE60949.1 Glycosyltransferase involved in cell wall bisynthesis [Riemerella columbipharyngis]